MDFQKSSLISSGINPAKVHGNILYLGTLGSRFNVVAAVLLLILFLIVLDVIMMEVNASRSGTHLPSFT